MGMRSLEKPIINPLPIVVHKNKVVLIWQARMLLT